MQGKNLNQLMIELERDEARRAKPYKCSAGKLTIGVGRNLEDVGLSREEQDLLLKNDIKRAVKAAERYSWYSGLTPARKRVIVNMIFNLGAPTFSKFKKTIAYIRAGDYGNASIEMLDSQWAGQVGRRANRLSVMMKNG